ncbi:hypothetical protein C8R43DRAFT_826915, partial [Mycena crocata]
MFLIASSMVIRLLVVVSTYHVGTKQAESHPALQSRKCTSAQVRHQAPPWLQASISWRTNYEMLLTQNFTCSTWAVGSTAHCTSARFPYDGGLSTANRADTKYEIGFCDSQCPR